MPASMDSKPKRLRRLPVPDPQIMSLSRLDSRPILSQYDSWEAIRAGSCLIVTKEAHEQDLLLSYTPGGGGGGRGGCGGLRS